MTTFILCVFVSLIAIVGAAIITYQDKKSLKD